MWRVVVLSTLLTLYLSCTSVVVYRVCILGIHILGDFQSSSGDSRLVSSVADGYFNECCMNSFRVLIFDLFRMRLSEGRMW